MLAALESGESTITPTIFRSAEHERYTFFTVPYVTIPVVIITNRFIAGSLTLDDLAGKLAAVFSSMSPRNIPQSGQWPLRVVAVRNVPDSMRQVVLAR